MAAATSKPATYAQITSCPVAPVFSALANRAGTSTTLGWPYMSAPMSSKSRLWPDVPLTKAAAAAGTRSCVPKIVACAAPPSSRTMARTGTTGDAPAPATRAADGIRDRSAGTTDRDGRKIREAKRCGKCAKLLGQVSRVHCRGPGARSAERG